MTLGGIVGMLATAPAGALVDASRHKRGIVVVVYMMITLASLVLLVSQGRWTVAASQVVAAVGGATLGPVVVAVTLGIVREHGFDRQFGRNQVANYAGNVVGAALSGWMGWRFGFDGIFALAGAFGAMAIVSAVLIPRNAIDQNSARGLGAGSA